MKVIYILFLIFTGFSSYAKKTPTLENIKKDLASESFFKKTNATKQIFEYGFNKKDPELYFILLSNLLSKDNYFSQDLFSYTWKVLESYQWPNELIFFDEDNKHYTFLIDMINTPLIAQIALEQEQVHIIEHIDDMPDEKGMKTLWFFVSLAVLEEVDFMYRKHKLFLLKKINDRQLPIFFYDFLHHKDLLKHFEAVLIEHLYYEDDEIKKVAGELLKQFR